MFAKRNDEMTQLYKLKMRKRGLVREDEGERKKEILWTVNVVSLRNEAIYVPHNVADESLVYESAFPQAIGILFSLLNSLRSTVAHAATRSRVCVAEPPIR